MLEQFWPFVLLKAAISFTGSCHTQETVVCIHKKEFLNYQHISVIYGTLKHDCYIQFDTSAIIHNMIFNV